MGHRGRSGAVWFHYQTLLRPALKDERILTPNPSVQRKVAKVNQKPISTKLPRVVFTCIKHYDFRVQNMCLKGSIGMGLEHDET